MSSKYKDKDGGVVLTFNGQWVSWSHTGIAYSKSDHFPVCDGTSLRCCCAHNSRRLPAPFGRQQPHHHMNS